MPVAIHLFALLLLAATAPVAASTDAAWAANARAGRAACLAASDLAKARASAAVAFDDTAGVDAMLVSGIWRPRHMHGARGTMLCLYHRAGKTAEIVEAAGWTAPAR